MMGLRGWILLVFVVAGVIFPESSVFCQTTGKNGGHATLYFQNNSSDLLRDYRTNSSSFALLDTLLATPPRPIDSILIVGYASSIGWEGHNRQLALLRARAVKTYLRWQYPYLRKYRLVPVGHAAETPGNDDLSGVRETSNDEDTPPGLQRRAVVSIVWTSDGRNASSPVLPEVGGVSAVSPAVVQDAPKAHSFFAAPVPRVSADSLSGPRFALKTNLLYWTALTPNIEAEYYFAKRWSLNLEYQGAWWADKNDHKFFRIMAGGPEVRLWIAHREHFRGHFLGAFVGVGSYEFMARPSYGLQGEFYITGGLSYGYAFRVGKRMRMEASFGVGYMLTEYREYHWDAGCYVYDRTKRQTYIGPTKAKLTLTCPLWWFGPKRKGGVR